MCSCRRLSLVPLAGLVCLTMWLGTPTQGQETGFLRKCLPQTGGRNVSLPRLDCLELYPTNEFPGVTGAVQLRRAPGPFSISVTTDGHIRYALLFDIEGLPPADTFGPEAVYIAWVTTPSFAPTVKLGEVENGLTLVGRQPSISSTSWSLSSTTGMSQSELGRWCYVAARQVA